MPQVIAYRSPDNVPVYRCTLCGDLVVDSAGAFADDNNPPPWDGALVCIGDPAGGIHVPY